MNPTRLFVASCLALVSTSMSFSIRADIIPALKTEFGFTDQVMGIVAGPGLWGFAITIVLGGMIVDAVGMKRVMQFAFLGHLAGVLLTVFATGFKSLYLGTLLIGLANGAVEAVVNPLAATLYPNSKTKHLNMLHAWFPGGLVIGGLLAYAVTKLLSLDLATTSLLTQSLGWKIKMALIAVPTLAYGYMIAKETFPQTERVTQGVTYKQMWAEAFRPMFVLFMVLMMMTTATELGPDQWVGNLLQNLVGIQGILILVYTAGIMFILRQFFAGKIVGRFGPLGVLTISAVLSFVGLYTLGSARTALTVFLAATIFGFGKTFFWPTMCGVVAERFPKGGALLLGLLGGAGMFSLGWVVTPVMGAIQDHYAVEALSPEVRSQVITENGRGIDQRRVTEITSAQVHEEVKNANQVSAVMTYRIMALLPLFLSFVFGGLGLYFRARGGYRAVDLASVSNSGLVTAQ